MPQCDSSSWKAIMHAEYSTWSSSYVRVFGSDRGRRHRRFGLLLGPWRSGSKGWTDTFIWPVVLISWQLSSAQLCWSPATAYHRIRGSKKSHGKDRSNQAFYEPICMENFCYMAPINNILCEIRNSNINSKTRKWLSHELLQTSTGPMERLRTTNKNTYQNSNGLTHPWLWSL